MSKKTAATLVKNKTTPENRAFREHVEKVAEHVRHWPKYMGGEGIEPLECPTCGKPLKEPEVTR